MAVTDQRIRVIIDNEIRNEKAIDGLAKKFQTKMGVIRRSIKVAQKEQEAFQKSMARFDKVANSVRNAGSQTQQQFNGIANSARRSGEEQDRMRQRINKAKKSIIASSNKQRFLADMSDNLNVSTRDVTGAMSRLGFVFNNSGEVVDQAGRKVNNLGQKIGRTIPKVRGFKFEWLSVMFAGMALQRAMSGLLRTSLEWTGVMDVLSTALGVMFLPVALMILDWALIFLDWVTSLSPETQKLIGVFVLFAGVLGTAALILGQIMLGLGGFILLFPQLGAAIFKAGGLFGFLKTMAVGAFKGIIAAFTGLTAPILAVIAVIVAVVIGAIHSWKTNFLGFRETVGQIWEGIKQIFKGAFQFIGGLWDVLVGIFTLDFSRIGDGLKGMAKGIGNFFFGILRTVVSFVSSIATSVLGFVDKIVGLFNKGRGLGLNTKDPFGFISKIPSFQTGGIMPHTGLAMLHKGERIIPAGQTTNNVSPNITVNATVSSDYDVRRLADQLKRYWVEDFESLSQRRGSV